MSNSRSFKRGLSHDAIEAFINYIPNQRWLHSLIEHKNKRSEKRATFFAIRNDYINIYGHGGSLVKLTYEAGSIVGETHFKYLLRKKMQNGNVYVPIKDGKPVFKFDKSSIADMFVDSLDDGGLLLDQSKLYAGVEKIGVHQLLMSNPNVLDTEITFNKDTGEDQGSNKKDRIDFCALRKGNGGKLNIVFYEAKHISNPELNGDVLDQLERYRKQIHERKEQILDSYRLVCKNIVELCNATDINIPFLEYAELVVNDSQSLTVDLNPRLVIFGYDGDQVKGIVEKIKTNLINGKVGEKGHILKVDEEHILCRGNPGGEPWTGVKFDEKGQFHSA